MKITKCTGGLVLAMQVISKLPEDNAVHLPCKKGDPLFVLTSDSPLGYEKTKCKKMTVVFREDGPAIKITAPSKPPPSSTKKP